MKSLTYIEIDVDAFALASPQPETTFRFTREVDYLPADIEAISSIKSVSYTPSRISLGENLGERATLTIAFMDHRHIFDGEDYDSGTFWGKWRARYGTRLRGKSVRWYQGLLGQTLAQMEERHFLVESTTGPDANGAYQIIAKDVLKLADGDRAQAPLLSNGFIVANIDDSVTSATLSPAGIGNAEYPASGHVAIGGEEICAFTRSGDVLTLTRGQLGTLAAAHEAGDRAQLVLRYVGEDPGDIIADLLENYAGVPASYVPLTTWNTETDAFLQRLYTATIAEPVSVNKLISELVEQAALAVWWEASTQLIRLQVLRPISTDAARFTEQNTMEGSLRIKDQPGTRISQVWTYFGQRNPLEPIDEEKNFRSVAISANLEAEAAYGGASIKKIFSRWIPFGGRQVAERLNDILLGRFVDPPRHFTFETFRYGDVSPMLGGGYRVEAWPIQNVDGTPTNAPIQITRLNPMADRYQIEAEEMLFEAVGPVDLTNRVIIIDSGTLDVNLRELHDSIYPAPTGSESPAITVTCFIAESAIVGASEANRIAFDVGDWPMGIDIAVYVRGRIQGAGGDGGNAGNNATSQAGEDGGTALYTRYPIDLILDEGDGEIWGGGGGGGGGNGEGDEDDLPAGGGGGGAGQIPGDGGVGYLEGPAGEPGTNNAGGQGGEFGPGEFVKPPGGDGGDLGRACRVISPASTARRATSFRTVASPRRTYCSRARTCPTSPAPQRLSGTSSKTPRKTQPASWTRRRTQKSGPQRRARMRSVPKTWKRRRQPWRSRTADHHLSIGMQASTGHGPLARTAPSRTRPMCRLAHGAPSMWRQHPARLARSHSGPISAATCRQSRSITSIRCNWFFTPRRRTTSLFPPAAQRHHRRRQCM
jgi:hypothetical protein